MYSPAERPSSTRAAPAKKRRLSAHTGISSRAYGERLADVARLDLGQLLGVRVDDVGELQQHLRPLARRRVEPFGQGLLRCLDRGVDVGRGARRHRGDRLARRRVQHLHRAARRPRRPTRRRRSSCGWQTVVLIELLLWLAPSQYPGVAGEPHGDRDRDDRQRDHREDDDVHLRQLLIPGESAPRIQIGSVFSGPAVNVVTITSSNESAKASRPPATSAVARIGQGHVAERLPAVRAEIHRGLDQRRCAAAQAGEHVVVDDDDAEGRVPDHDRPEVESRDARRMTKNEFSAIPVMIPGSAIGRTSRNEIASRPKNRNAVDRKRGRGAEDERDRRRQRRRPSRRATSESRDLLVVPRGRNQCGRPAGDRPAPGRWRR